MPQISEDHAARHPALDADSSGLGDLMHAAFRGLRRRWMHQLAPFDLTPHQFRALNAVARVDAAGSVQTAGDDGCAESAVAGVRLKDLAERLRIAPRSATEVVDQLQDKGLLARTPDPSDRRATLLLLTADGAKLRDKVLADRRREADEYFSGLSPQDRTDLQRILGQLTG
ncbi:MarR family transcriptional regulator [Arthrobacter jiangjiafuii]|uniref:MarR family transcriptional regulator n=1 Tax=Arthrobacter jiangjiafuii TaxID=2817475 RepID=A0A975M7Q0_9MICC|nr:MarR family transcriptional regulator [Arthrobacter jiangjiafuii]MBP3042958.1 MarR family transcriptional regulator [Arthrobacter jiangjiafuii]QWC11485.1 MarR family transcriptional regulator [Arthrobacter jiangjiafuii]